MRCCCVFKGNLVLHAAGQWLQVPRESGGKVVGLGPFQSLLFPALQGLQGLFFWGNEDRSWAIQAIDRFKFQICLSSRALDGFFFLKSF